MISHVPALKSFGISLVLFLLVGTGCKKKREFNQESCQTTVDVRYGISEMDEVLKDINIVIEERNTLRNRNAGVNNTQVCGLKLDTTGQLQGRMTMIYDGSNCYGRIRTGVVTFTIQDYPVYKWKHKNSVLVIDFVSYQATRSSDGKSVKLQGRQTLTNESGNSWFELLYGGAGTVTYLHEGDKMKLTFPGNSTAVFSVKRRLTFSHVSGITSCQVEGAGNAQGRGRVEAWGQDTEGNTFASEVVQPYLWKTSCGAVAPVKGEVHIVREGIDWDLKSKYGIDSEGNQISESATSCPFGWEVTWSRKKKTNSRLFGYY